MSDAIIVGCISSGVTLAIAFIGLVGSNKKVVQKLESISELTKYRIGELEKKMDKHNQVLERTAVVERDLKTAFNRIDEIKADVREMRERDK